MLEVINIKKSYGSNTVLNDVSFSISDGEIFGLIGVNGVGKTTLINIIAGLLQADSGSYSAEGGVTGNCVARSNHTTIGYLPDVPEFYDYLTAGEYLDFLLKYKNEQQRSRLLNMVSISEKVKIGNMSRGMRQRLGIAAAIVNNPDVILLDEPTSALDPGGRQDLMKILTYLKKEGKTILLSTHILTDMEKICDKVAFLSDGVIKKCIKISELANECEYIDVIFRTTKENEGIKKTKEANQTKSINETEVTRETKDIGKTIKNHQIDAEKIGDVYRFRVDRNNPTESQKRIMECLIDFGYEIKTINTKTNSLDELFKSICL